jgi:hypothetical protein
VVGLPYSDARAMISQDGGTPIVATRTGGVAAEDDCLVTNAWDAPFVRNGSAASGEVMVALNCNGGLATAGSPGNSAASPEGRQAKAAEDDNA